MQTFNSFNELAATGQIVENDGFDMSSPAVPSVNNPQSATNPPPKIPQWGSALSQRVASLETGFAEMKTEFAEMKADIAEIKRAVLSK